MLDYGYELTYKYRLVVSNEKQNLCRYSWALYFYILMGVYPVFMYDTAGNCFQAAYSAINAEYMLHIVTGEIHLGSESAPNPKTCNCT